MSLFMISSMISLEGRIAYCLHVAQVVQEKNLFTGTSKEPGIIPRAVNVLCNTTGVQLNKMGRFKANKC